MVILLIVVNKKNLFHNSKSLFQSIQTRPEKGAAKLSTAHLQYFRMRGFFLVFCIEIIGTISISETFLSPWPQLSPQ